jgi:hypothetical protein
VAEITADQVHDLLTSTHEYMAAGRAATRARDRLGHLFLDTARQAKVGLRELSAVSGLHHSTIRAMLQRAIGPGLPDGWDQPALPIMVEPAASPIPEHRHVAQGRPVPLPPPPIASKSAPGLVL